MKKLALAAGMALTVASSATWAGGIQIQPLGNGAIGGSVFFTSPPGAAGNALADNALLGSGTSGGGTLWGHNAHELTSVGIAGGELTFEFSLPVLSSLTGPAGTLGTQLTLANVPLTLGTFNLYFDSPLVGGTIAAGSNTQRGIGSNVPGNAFNDGVLIASGTVRIGNTGGSFGITNTSGGTAGPMAANDATPSISAQGSATLLVDFTFRDANYVVNALDALTIDLTDIASLDLLFLQGPSPIPTVFASQAFGSGTVGRNFGGDGTNNFACGDLGPACDVQLQMTATLLFDAPQVPEPGTMALLGAGLGLIGIRRRRSARS